MGTVRRSFQYEKMGVPQAQRCSGVIVALLMMTPSSQHS